MRVSVIGMGKTGLPIAVALQSKGNQILGVEINQQRLNQLVHASWSPEEPCCAITCLLLKASICRCLISAGVANPNASAILNPLG
ncbi:hypothetical protein LCGC14_1437590, partial [marine sediment metagenome]